VAIRADLLWCRRHGGYAMTELAGEPVSYRDVETDGAARAAQLIAELI